MIKHFQPLFVSPSSQEMLKFSGDFDFGRWANGVLKSSQEQWEVKNGIPLFKYDDVGDQFSPDDIKEMHVEREWQAKLRIENPVYIKLCEEAVAIDKPILDIASGPGLGLVPYIVSKGMKHVTALASDACSLIVLSWQRFLKSKGLLQHVSLSSFDIRNMPIKSNTIDVITSNDGFTAVRLPRGTKYDRDSAVREAYRVLKPGGSLFAVESVYEKAGLLELCSAIGEDFERQWDNRYNYTWAERFCNSGFIIEWEFTYSRMKVPAHWNTEAQKAAECGIDLWNESRAYRLTKPE